MIQDKQISTYWIFLLVLSFLALGGALLFCTTMANQVQGILAAHDAAVATSLLDQGVPETTIAAALMNTAAGEDGQALLAKAGYVNTHSPLLLQLQQDRMIAVMLFTALLLLALLVGTTIFFVQRKRLYHQAETAVSGYLDSDFSLHLPQNREGMIFQLFADVEQLAMILQSKNETEQQAKEFLKHSISDISHQLKTPLAALTMYQEIIADEPEHPDTVREFSAKMSVSLRRMEYLIQSMLKITRLDTGNITFEKQTFSVAELVSQSIRELTTRAVRENKQILIDGDTRQHLVCDRDWTCEAIGNIVKNALDHTDAGGTVRVHWEHTPAMLRIFISDNGSGIAPEDIHHIFKRFYRSKRSLDIPGIGLGLPLAKSIIEGQGGIVSVQSDPGAGTTFILSFLTEL